MKKENGIAVQENQGIEVVKPDVSERMITLAIEKGADLDKLEKLLQIRREWEKDEARKAYNDAMAEFKANPPEIDKDRQVVIQHKNDPGQTKYKHASLFNVTEKINTALSKHGLSASWRVSQNGAITVTCKITHMKGHSEETTLSAPADISGSKNAIQAIGSTITYLERYTLLALTGLATYEQDDDGHAATPVYITEQQAHVITDMVLATNTDMKKFLKYVGVENLEKIPASKYQIAINALDAKAAKQKAVKK